MYHHDLRMPWISRWNKWILGSFSCPYCHLLLMKFCIKMYCHEQYVVYHHDLHVTLSYHMLVFTVLNATFNNISAISWRSVLLVEETGVFGENSRPVASHRQTLSHNIVSSTLHNVSGDRHWLWLVINPTTIRSRTRISREIIIETFNFRKSKMRYTTGNQLSIIWFALRCAKCSSVMFGIIGNLRFWIE